MPEIPGVSVLTDALAEYKTLRRPDRLSYFEREKDNRQYLFKWIAEQRSENPPQFEEALAMLEDLGGLFREGAGRDHSLAPFLDLESNQLASAGQQLLQAAGEAGRFVISEVAEACNTVDGTKHHLGTALNHLSSNNRLLVFSLNYDDVPETTSNIQFETGFDRCGEFDPRRLATSRDHLHVQLHGSVLWSHNFSANRLGFRRENSRLIAQSHRAYVSSQWFSGGKRGINTPFITGGNKPLKVSTEPMSSYFWQFRKAAFDCNDWLIIGYGSADEHINTILRSAYFYKTRSRDPLAIRIIDFENTDGLPTFFEHLQNNSHPEYVPELHNVGPKLRTLLGQFAPGPLYEYAERRIHPFDVDCWQTIGGGIRVTLGGLKNSVESGLLGD